ncbi:hypothetical protein KJ678_04495 [Patescibacteria group bacterium]|nr:hypothetical protein [Patescibacteria group bacterium]
MTKLKFSDIFFPLALLLVVIAIFISNYAPGTYLTGWDNLHPEFDLKLNLSRGIFSVWEEYQGLGLLTGNAHSANILHTLFMYFLRIFGTPVNLMRYTYHFSMLFTGVLGLYFLLKKVKLGNAVSFLGALFYCLNLGTAQIFYTPYISFSHFYGLLPWLLYSLVRYANNSSKKNLLVLFLINVLAVPAFYIPTIFIVYVVCVLLFGFVVLVKKTRLFKVLGIVFAVNSFWLLSFLYFIFNNLSVRYGALSSSMSSDILFMENVKHGNLANTLLLKGFWFGNVDLQIEQGKFDYMLRPWIDYMQNPPVLIIGYILSAIVFFGFAVTFIRLLSKKYKNNTFLIGFAGIFLISLFFLLNENFPLGFIYHFLRQTFPLFAEVFRFPFTKWVVPAALAYSVFFAVGVSVLIEKVKFRGLNPLKGSTPMMIFIMFILLIVWMFPIFKGNLIYTNMKVKIPNEYFELFDFFKTVPKTERIANFPQYTFWGWNYYKWGYRGSGFLWYGLEQPILDRAFDVWNVQNENYYKNVSYALYSENAQLFYDVLNKYQINWVLVDTNVIQPEGVLESLYISKLEALLENNPKIVLAKDLGSIKVYKVMLNYFPQNYSYFSGKRNDYNVIRGDISEIDADIASRGREGYTINFEKPLKTSKKEVLEKYFNNENLIPVEIWAGIKNGNLDLKFSYKVPLFEDGELSLVKTINVGRQTDFILAINSSQFIRLNNLGSVYKSYGKILMPTKGNTALNLYNGNADYVKRFESKDFIDTVYSCSASTPDSKVSAILEEGAVKLVGENSAPCFLLKEIVEKNDEYNLISVSYGYKSLAEELPEYCFLTDSSGKCLNNKFGNRPRSSLSWDSYTDFVEFSKSSYSGEVFLAFALDAYDEEKTIWYKDIRLTFYPLVFSETANPLEFLVSGYGEGDNLDMASINFGKDYFVFDIDANSNLHSQYARNCDRFNSLFVDKEISAGALIYYSKNAVNCEDFELLNLPQAVGYVFAVNSQNLKGLALSFCISNTLSKRCDVVQKANSSESYLVLPAMSSSLFDLGYIFHLDNTSIGNIETANKLNNISVYYYPSLFIKSLFEGERVGDKFSANTATIINSVRYNPAFYKLTAKLPKGESFLVFGQSYEKGWIMLDFRGSILPHHLVNSWANGWTIGCDDWKGEGVCENDFFIIFWPQILEFIGFAILLIAYPVIARNES